jgi:hypothetical protein
MKPQNIYTAKLALKRHPNVRNIPAMITTIPTQIFLQQLCE